MTNADWIKSLSNQQLADYILSIYRTGIVVGKNKIPIPQDEFVDYNEWLDKERVND